MEPPHDFICSITQEIMVNPVICASGHSYDHDAIQCWLATNHTCPKTNEHLRSKSLTPNHALRSLIREWVQTEDQVAKEKLIVKESFTTVVYHKAKSKNQ